jgi:hypothetical protein
VSTRTTYRNAGEPCHATELVEFIRRRPASFGDIRIQRAHDMTGRRK